MCSDQANANGVRTAVAAGEGAEIGCVDIVHDHVGVVVVHDVVTGKTDGPFVLIKSELFFQSDVEADVFWKIPAVCRTNKLALVVYGSVGKPGVVLEKIAGQKLPVPNGKPREGRPPAGNDTVG